LTLYLHAFTDEGGAGLNIRAAIDDHHAGSTLADGAKKASGTVLFGTVAEVIDSGSVQSGGDRFAFISLHWLAVKLDCYSFSSWKGQDWVLNYSHRIHSS